MIRILLLLLVATSSSALKSPENYHDFHVSRLTINLNAKEDRLEFTLDTFIDDMEAAIASSSQQKLTTEIVNLFDEKETSTADSLLAVYITRNLSLSINQRPLDLSYLGKEAAEDPYAMYVYMQADYPIDQILSGTLNSSFLIDLYDDQQNIIVWQINGKTSSNDLLTFGRRESNFSK